MGRWLDRARQRQRERGDPAALDSAQRGAAEPPGAFSPLTSTDIDDIRHTLPSTGDPRRAWYHRNAELLTDDDRRLGRDPGGYCVEHRRGLSYPEQKRGACSWCVPVDPEREPEYWASHWRRFTERP
jgi:hypothetical protein